MKHCLLFAAIIFLSACSGVDDEKDLAVIIASGTLVDLTYSFDENTIYWPTAEGFVFEFGTAGDTEAGFYYEAHSFRGAEHGGTHLDAPIHFSRDKLTADQIPLKNLIAPAIVIDVTVSRGDNPDYLISAGDIMQWETVNGQIEDGTIVLFRSGFGQYWPSREDYLGTDERGPEAVAQLHFPGLDPEAARWLVSESNVAAVGIDTASIDFGQSTLFESHQILFGENIPVFENVANLDRLPLTGVLVMALPMKITGGSGGPLRIAAWVGH
jgi:kynurenine formamidase